MNSIAKHYVNAEQNYLQMHLQTTSKKFNRSFSSYNENLGRMLRRHNIILPPSSGGDIIKGVLLQEVM